jgi:DNA-directed RNA polymerase I subunit RPA1
MGKRVNYACRSVISPDPYIETNEIGIPPVFAKKLTYPEPVTPHNVTQLRQNVINGPTVWPGATHIQNEDGTLVNLSSFTTEQRTALSNSLMTPTDGTKTTHINKKVYRHLRNGDFLLLNRQPTLHKPSIMAHTARILPGEKTLRMHYANCNTYNADFDGDEMNAHFPQNELARAEAMEICRNDLQYLVPTDGSVLRGLIQDHIDAGVDLTSKNTFLTRERYFSLVYAALRPRKLAADGNIEKQVEIGENGRILTMPPAICKPQQMWTGKQVISTILYNITPKGYSLLNMSSKTKIAAAQWGPTGAEEAKVIIDGGYYCTGILDKSQIGASNNGLVHYVYETYGPSYASTLLSIFGRLFTSYLQNTGFSCRMDDLLLTPAGDVKRSQLISETHKIGPDALEELKALSVLEREKILRSTERMAQLDSAMKQRTNRVTSGIISSTVPSMLYKPFPSNNMQTMTLSGAKGSGVNVSQISCLLGQQELEGKRVPTMVSGKTLPSFKAFDPSARAGGYITGRFLTGIAPQEYYFHCMAGREGLIDTAVKTSRSGYLQRCLIKHLEGLKVHYDHTVRDTDSSVIQFQYGEDSLDILKQTTLTNFEFNASNYDSMLKRLDVERLIDSVNEKSVRKFRKRDKEGIVLEHFSPSSNVGATSEKFNETLEDFVKSSTQLVDKEAKRNFKTMMNLKYMNSLIDPGEHVGLLAAQSIGEPSTQMTLNTFHFAGFGAKNVTLGIPRLREIIMTASSNLKTPLMKLPTVEGITAHQADDLCNEISRLCLAGIMKSVNVTEQLTKKSFAGERYKMFSITLEFWDVKDYATVKLTPSKLAELLEVSFVPALERAINRDLKGRIRREEEADALVGKSLGSAATPKDTEDEDETQPKKDKDSDSEASEEDDEDRKVLTI